MAESEPPEDERQDPPAETADTPETPDAAAETPDAAAETPGPAGDDAPAEGVTDALEAAAEEIPASDTGPGEGLTPEPPVEAAAATPEPPPEAEAATPEPTPEAEAEAEPAAAEEGPSPVPAAPAETAAGGDDVVPGAHLEPDLVLEERREETPATASADSEQGAQPQPAGDSAPGVEQPAPIAGTPMDLAADARYQATGKRKSSVARVILRPGSGSYTVNGRPLAAFFPRPTLQKRVQQPLETAGYESRMDVVARIHGGGVSSQAGALRHGVARALVVADPNLRQELKRRGFLTRDARVKERKKAGLKKARKRPQFSKR